MAVPTVDEPIISADSHIVEPPNLYVDYIEPSYRDEAPHVIHHEKRGDLYVIPGMSRPIAIGPLAAAGILPEDLKLFGNRFEDLHKSGSDANFRVADQERDGVHGEVIYPTVGMLICNHKDLAYKQACFDAYNRWMADYCSVEPDRLFGLGQSALASPEEGIAELERLKEMGLRGLMMPGFPGDSYNGDTPDYDDESWDPFYRASIELEMPLSFHILTMGQQRHRGPRMGGFLSIIRGNQDVISMFVLGGVFERIPELKIICTEADAGWIPHYMYRMDHAFKRHSRWMERAEMSRLPSEYCLDNVRLTFQDDWVAFKMCRLDPEIDMSRMLMWANDFPHSDSTWPWSQEMLDEHTKSLTPEEKRMILHDNVASVYNLPTVDRIVA